MVSCEYIIVMVCDVNKVVPHTGGGGGGGGVICLDLKSFSHSYYCPLMGERIAPDQ